jgi:hypothetical protein
VKFTVDENLPTEYASILRGAGFETDTVSDEELSGASNTVLSESCRVEDRVLRLWTWISRISKHALQNRIRESWSFVLSLKTSQRLLLF